MPAPFRPAKRSSPPRARSGSPASAPPSSRAIGRRTRRARVLPHAGQGRHRRRVAHVPHGRRPPRRRRSRWRTTLWRSARDTVTFTVKQAAETADDAGARDAADAPAEDRRCPRLKRCLAGQAQVPSRKAKTVKAAQRTARPRRQRQAHREARDEALVTRLHCGPNGRPDPHPRAPGPSQDEHRRGGSMPSKPARRSAHPAPAVHASSARRARASASRSPAAVRSAASTRSARCSRSPIRSTASTSTTSTPTSACRPAASSPPRSRTASRRRRCTGCSSTTAPTRRSSPRSSCVPRSASSAAARPRCPGSRGARACSTCAIPFRPGVMSVVRDALAGDAHRRVRQPRDRRLPLAAVLGPRAAPTTSATLGRKLFLVATNLDTGASVTFGAPGHDHVPISRAIQASSALPGLFPPVEIDGEHYVDGALNKTLHASVALDEGIELLLCVNPLVPVRRVPARRGAAASPSRSSTRADCRWCSRRRSARSSIRG